MCDSKKNALKAIGIVGGAQIIKILIQIIRTKIIAVLLGLSGVGIAGLFLSTLELVRGFTGFGIGFSAVRDVAEASGSGDEARIGRTVTILRRWVWLTGLLGLALLVLFRNQFSLYSFKSSEYAWDFVWLSVVPLFSALSGGQLALLQGLRKISDMALAGVLGAVAGLLITAPVYWYMGVSGIVPAFILAAMVELGLSCYFARKVKLTPSNVSLRETVEGGFGMIRLGLFMVFTTLAGSGTMYLVRIFISDKMGLDGVGIFQAAWNISVMYVGLILGAMGADYFPRLSAVNSDSIKVCRLVNEQTEIALLLAGPIIIVMICFMDIFVSLFYSAKFGQSIDILLWQSLGNLFKIISWPMGFVILAKGKGNIVIITELLWNFIFLGSIYCFWDKFNLEIVGIAFTVCYLFLTLIVWFICRKLCVFSWTKRNCKLISVYAVLAIIAFVSIKYRFFSYWRIINISIVMLGCYMSFHELKKIMDMRLVIVKMLNKVGIQIFNNKAG